MSRKNRSNSPSVGGFDPQTIKRRMREIDRELRTIDEWFVAGGPGMGPVPSNLRVKQCRNLGRQAAQGNELSATKLTKTFRHIELEAEKARLGEDLRGH